jgi:hypothetical protein
MAKREVDWSLDLRQSNFATDGVAWMSWIVLPEASLFEIGR